MLCSYCARSLYFLTFVLKQSGPIPVSYTHLDVYKRQLEEHAQYDAHGRRRRQHASQMRLRDLCHVRQHLQHHTVLNL